MSTDQPKPVVKLIAGNEEVMIHWPSGRVQFLGAWGLIKFMWWAAKNRVNLVIEDGGKQ